MITTVLFSFGFCFFVFFFFTVVFLPRHNDQTSVPLYFSRCSSHGSVIYRIDHSLCSRSALQLTKRLEQVIGRRQLLQHVNAMYFEILHLPNLFYGSR